MIYVDLLSGILSEFFNSIIALCRTIPLFCTFIILTKVNEWYRNSRNPRHIFRSIDADFVSHR